MNEKLVDIALDLMDQGDFMGAFGTYKDAFNAGYALVLRAYAVGAQDAYGDPSPPGLDGAAYTGEDVTDFVYKIDPIPTPVWEMGLGI